MTVQLKAETPGRQPGAATIEARENEQLCQKYSTTAAYFQPSFANLTAELARLDALYSETGDGIYLAEWLAAYAERERVRRFGERAFDGGAK